MRKTKEEKIQERTRERESIQERQYKALAYLKHVRGLAARVQSLQDEIELMRETLDGVKSVTNSGKVSVGSVYADAIPDTMIRLEELIREYCKELVYYVDVNKEAHDLVKKLPHKDQASVLVRRFLIGESSRDVANALCYRYEEVITLEAAGLESLYEYMPQYWRDREVPQTPDFAAMRREFARETMDELTARLAALR